MKRQHLAGDILSTILRNPVSVWIFPRDTSSHCVDSDNTVSMNSRNWNSQLEITITGKHTQVAFLNNNIPCIPASKGQLKKRHQVQKREWLIKRRSPDSTWPPRFGNNVTTLLWAETDQTDWIAPIAQLYTKDGFRKFKRSQIDPERVCQFIEQLVFSGSLGISGSRSYIKYYNVQHESCATDCEMFLSLASLYFFFIDWHCTCYERLWDSLTRKKQIPRKKVDCLNFPLRQKDPADRYAIHTCTTQYALCNMQYAIYCAMLKCHARERTRPRWVDCRNMELPFIISRKHTSHHTNR